MTARRIMIIRHGEKPDPPCASPLSVMTPGDDGADNLSPRGWQRAGALVRFFAAHGDHDGRPAALFAARADASCPSLRTRQTLEPLSDFLGQDSGAGMPIATPAAPEDVDAAARAILDATGPALVAWEHKNIARLVAAITGDGTLAPHWGGHRFDVVLVLDGRHGTWSLAQVPQMLLAGDSEKPLRDRYPGEDR